MAGFVLGNTLSEYGAVTRGVCKVNADGSLADIVETSNIYKDGSSAYVEKNGRQPIDFNSPVSMNMWGFTPEILTELYNRFPAFLERSKSNPLTAEYLLPEVVDNLIKEGLATVSVLHTNDKWFGVTYQEDKQFVMDSFTALTEQGVYPKYLFPDK